MTTLSSDFLSHEYLILFLLFSNSFCVVPVPVPSFVVSLVGQFSCKFVCTSYLIKVNVIQFYSGKENISLRTYKIRFLYDCILHHSFKSKIFLRIFLCSNKTDTTNLTQLWKLVINNFFLCVVYNTFENIREISLQYL